MITKETARRIFNCHQQIEEIDQLKQEMLAEVEKQREAEKNRDHSKPIPESRFGRFGTGMQLGVPTGSSMSSMRIFGISPETGILVMDEQRQKLLQDLRELETIAKLELSINENKS